MTLLQIDRKHLTE